MVVTVNGNRAAIKSD